MKSYRTIHQFLMVLAFVPLILSWGPWYLMILIPLAAVIPYGINEMVLEKKRPAAGAFPDDAGNIAHAYREGRRASRKPL